MVFPADTDSVLQAAVELANSALPPDTLTSVADLTEFVTRREYTGQVTGDADELAQVRAIRPRLAQLLSSERDAAVGLVNAILTESAAVPQLVRHAPTDWHIHAVDPQAPLARRILVETAMAMIDVIRADETSRLSVCEDADCQGIVLDLTRNRSRRYCSTTCGNRNAAAAYRARQAGRTG